MSLAHLSPKFRRLELLNNNEIPTQNEIKHSLGSNLAQVIFECSHPNIKHFLGMTSSLRGAVEELWMSPSDQLLEKVCLKPPLTQKCIKVCTHNGILQLGEQAKKKWEAETVKKLREELNSNLKEAKMMFQAEKRHAVNLAISHTKKLYEIHTNNLTKEYEKKLECLIARTMRKSNEKIQGLILRERQNVIREMMRRLRDEINYIVSHLGDEFERESQAQKEIMISEFNRIISHERAINESKLRDCHQQQTEELQSLKILLNEEFNAKKSDIIHEEREKIRAEQNSLNLCFQKKIEVLEDLLLESKYVIEVLGETKKRSYSLNNPPWRRKLCNIIRQFRKFVEIAFEVMPGQSEFIRLLEFLACNEYEDKPEQQMNKNSWYTMSNGWRTFDRTNSMRNEIFEVVEIIDKNGEKWRPIQLLPDIKTQQLFCTEEQLQSPIVKSEINICQDKNYIEKDSISSRSTLNSNDSLPFIYFKNKLYVRSDHKPDIEESSVEIKTMAELAEGGRFIVGSNDPGPENIIIKDIRDDPSSAVFKGKRCMNKNESLQNEFEHRLQDLIEAIERVKNESSNRARKSMTSNDDEVICDLINHLKMVKNSDEIPDENSNETVDDHDSIELASKQLACSRVKSLIKVFRLHPSLQNILIQTANNI